MVFKKMTDEFIALDVEKINGYLCAIEAINTADNTGVEYKLIRLSEKETLLKSVESYISVTHPDTVLDYWHINLEQINEDHLSKSINTWLFRFGMAKKLHKKLISLQIGFMDVLKQLVYTPNIYRINMTPPIWYATDWEMFLFDSKNGFFLLEFNFDS